MASAPPSPPARRQPPWLLLIVAVYAAAYLLWYWQTPLGLHPVLDGRETLALAAQVADGTLPHEPFYRAMGYPGLLGGLLALGLPAKLLPMAAGFLGLLGHTIAALCIGRVARGLWGSRAAAVGASLLYGLYPVALWLLAEPQDTAVALALWIGGWACLLQPSRQAPGRRQLLATGTLWGLAVVCRPQYAPVALLAPVAAWLLLPGNKSRCLLPWLGSGAVLTVYGCIQLVWGGVFGVLPWQGAYNLYASNRPESSGRYFTQSVTLGAVAPGQNPTRLESELLYGQQTGQRPPFSIAAMNAHWRQRTREAIAADPMGWLHLVSRKAYYLVNTWEPYNNKTYAWHRERSPWLRFNPLGWGLLFANAVAGLAIAARWAWVPTLRQASEDPRGPHLRALLGFSLLLAAYAAGVWLTVIGDRFRLPLAAGCAILAMGWVHALPALLRPPRSRRWLLAFGALLGGASMLTFSNAFGVRDTATYLMDEVLSGAAAAEAGEDALAWDHARAALTLQPAYAPAIELAVLSASNLVVTGPWAPLPAEARAEVHRLRLLTPSGAGSPAMDFAQGVIAWQMGQDATALTLWQRVATSDSALGDRALALRLSLGSATPGEQAAVPRRLQERRDPWLASSVRIPLPEAERLMGNILRRTDVKQPGE